MPRSHHSNPTASNLSSTSSNSNPETPASPVSTAPAAGVGAEALEAPTPTPLDARVASILTQLDAIEASLDLDIVVRPNDKGQIGALARVSDTALLLASDVVSAAPEEFVQFHQLPALATYVRSMNKLSLRASELASHIQKSVLNQRTPAAIQTLALYAFAKSLGRMPGNEAMRERVAALRVEIAPKRTNPKPRITKGEKAARRVADAKAKKLDAARKLLAAEMLLTPVPAPVSAAPPAPPVVAPATPAAPSPSAASPATNVVPLNGAAGAAH